MTLPPLTSVCSEWLHEHTVGWEQKGVNDVPLKTRRALSQYILYGDSALLVLNGTVNSNNALLTVDWRYICCMVFLCGTYLFLFQLSHVKIGTTWKKKMHISLFWSNHQPMKFTTFIQVILSKFWTSIQCLTYPHITVQFWKMVFSCHPLCLVHIGLRWSMEPYPPFRASSARPPCGGRRWLWDFCMDSRAPRSLRFGLARTFTHLERP